MPLHPRPSQVDDIRGKYPELYDKYPELYHDYPEVAPDIYAKIDAHGEEWVLDNWTRRYTQAGLIISVPDKEDLPFFDPEKHESMSDEQKREAARAMHQYRENVRNAGSDDD